MSRGRARSWLYGSAVGLMLVGTVQVGWGIYAYLEESKASFLVIAVAGLVEGLVGVLNLLQARRMDAS